MRSNCISFIVATAAIVSNHVMAFGVPDRGAPQLFGQRVLDSDHVVLTVFSREKVGSNSKRITVDDRSWIEDFSKVLSTAVYEPNEHIFAVSPPVLFYNKSGKKILELSVLPGDIIRIDSQDY